MHTECWWGNFSGKENLLRNLMREAQHCSEISVTVWTLVANMTDFGLAMLKVRNRWQDEVRGWKNSWWRRVAGEST